MTAALIILGILVLALGWVALDLFVFRRGIKLEWAGVTTYRLRLGSWLPKLLGHGGTTIGDVVHIAGGDVSAWLVSHEVAHVIRGAKVGRFPYLWRYVTSKRFRLDEELACNLWASINYIQVHPRWVADYVRKGAA